MSDRPNPRACTYAGVRQAPQETHCYELPDPPDNPSFELFSDRKQDEIDARFQCGIELGKLKRRQANAARNRTRKARNAHKAGRVTFAPKLGDVLRVRP